MAERIIMQRRGDMLVAVDPAGIDAIRKLPKDKPLGVTAVVPRNIKLHRKAFGLVQLAFHYWNPSNFITSVERKTVVSLGAFLVDHGIARETAKDLCTQFLIRLNAGRETLEAEKSFDAFRDFLTIDAGYYTVIHTPSGPRKEAKSWSFGSMDDVEFSRFFKALLSSSWRLVLSQHFATETDAEDAAEAMLGFE